MAKKNAPKKASAAKKTITAKSSAPAPVPVDTSTMEMPDVNAILNSEGPIVTVLHLPAGNGKGSKAVEVTMDMTPKAKNMHKLLGGEVTFLGQYGHEPEVEGVVIVINQRGGARNGHRLQPPFEGEVVAGDMVLMRTDEEGLPVDFTLKEWKKFMARTDVESPELPDEAEGLMGEEEEESGEEESGEEESGEEDSEEEEEPVDMVSMMMPMILGKFVADNGRNPNETELASIMMALEEKFGVLEGVAEGEEGEEESSEEEEEEEEEEEIIEAPKKKNKKASDENQSKAGNKKKVSLKKR